MFGGEMMKETPRERVRRIVSEKNLFSVMNDTKWRELQNSVRELPFPPPFSLKNVCVDEKAVHKFNEDVSYWGDWSDESFFWGDFFAIEWIKVRPRYKKHQGQLIADKIIDETKQFVEILTKYNIPYEEDNGAFIIYGYKPV